MKKDNIKKLIQIAEAFLIKNDVKKAEYISRQIIEIDSNNSEAYYFLGEALCKQGKFQESLGSLKQANKLFPNHPRIIHLLGWVTYMSGDIDLGRTYLQKALKELPEDSQILCDLAVLEISQDKGEEAKKYAVKALQIDPCNPLTQEVFQKVLIFDKASFRLKKRIPN